jgi:hypothetical protein
LYLNRLKASIAKASNLSENNEKCVANRPVRIKDLQRDFFGGHKIFPCKRSRGKGFVAFAPL